MSTNPSPYPGGGGLEPYQFSVSRLGSGSNDAPNISAAVASAVAYAQNNQGYAEVLTLDATGPYLINSPAVIGGTSYQGNALIPLPIIAEAGNKVVLKFRGGPSLAANTVPYFNQNTPTLNGTVWQTTRTDGTNDATNGPPFMLGGPWNLYGDTGLFSNMHVIVDGIEAVTPFNGTYGGFGFWGLAQASMLCGSYIPEGVAPSGQTFPKFNPNNITNQYTIGLLMPAGGNNDISTVLFFSAYAATLGFMPSEHTAFDHVICNLNIGGISPTYGGGNVQAHATTGKYASLEANIYAVYPYFGSIGINGKLNGFPKITIDCVDIESGGITQLLVRDPSPVMTASIGFQGPGYLNGYLNSGIVNSQAVASATGNRLIALAQQTGNVSSPAAAPATTVAWENDYYRDAWITVSLSGGHTFTSLNIDSVAQPGAAGVGQYSFLLPSGHTYTPTYSAGTLTHTVTLL